MNLNELIGQEITTIDPTAKGEIKVKYIITEAFPYYVKGIRVCENGAILTSCFNLGDLVTMGLIKVRAMPHTRGYRFVRKGYEGKV